MEAEECESKPFVGYPGPVKDLPATQTPSPQPHTPRRPPPPSRRRSAMGCLAFGLLVMLHSRHERLEQTPLLPQQDARACNLKDLQQQIADGRRVGRRPAPGSFRQDLKNLFGGLADIKHATRALASS